VNGFSHTTRLLSLLRLRPFDTSTVEGRSKERYRRAALTTVSASIARAVGALTLLASVPLTLSYLGPERYGLWMVLTSIISVMGFADLGIGNGLMNAVSDAYGKDDRDLTREHVASAFFLMLGIALLLAVAGAASYPFLPWVRLFNVKAGAVADEGARAFLVLYCWFVVNIPLGVVTRTQAGLQRGYSSQIVSAIGNIVSLLLLLLVIAFHRDLPWLVASFAIGGFSAIVFNSWLLFREHPWLIPSWRAYRASSAHTILKVGLMFFVVQCAVAVAYTSDNIVIAQVLGVAAVTAYAVPQKFFGVVFMLVSIAVSPLWPAYGEALARGDVGWVRSVFLGSLRLTFVITAPLSLLLALAGPWILKVTVGKSLHAPPSLLGALALWAVVAAISAPMAMLLNGAGVLREQTIIVVVASLTNLALSIFLTRRLGVVGVCLGSIATQLLIVLPMYSWVIRQLFKKMAAVAVNNSSQAAQNQLLRREPGEAR
jgi:O-antigen/teichoic acid export membrane protein